MEGHEEYEYNIEVVNPKKSLEVSLSNPTYRCNPHCDASQQGYNSCKVCDFVRCPIKYLQKTSINNWYKTEYKNP